MEFTFNLLTVVQSGAYLLLFYFMVWLLMDNKAHLTAADTPASETLSAWPTNSTFLAQGPRCGNALVQINPPPKFDGSPLNSFDTFRSILLNYFKLTSLQEEKQIYYLMSVLEGPSLQFFITNKLGDYSLDKALEELNIVFGGECRQGYHMETLFALRQCEKETIYEYFTRCDGAFGNARCREEYRKIFHFVNGLKSEQLKDRLLSTRYDTVFEVLNVCLSIKRKALGKKKKDKKCHICNKTGHKAIVHFT